MTLRLVRPCLVLLGLGLFLTSCADPPDPPPPAPASCDCALLTKSLEKAKSEAKPCPVVKAEPEEAQPDQAKPQTPEATPLADLEWNDFPAFDEAAQAAEVRRHGKAQSLMLKLPKKFNATDKKHSKSLLLTLLKGSASIQFGDEKAEAIKVGGRIRLPAQTSYSLKAKKETVWLLVSDGPL